MNDVNSKQKDREYETSSKIAWLLLGAIAFGGAAFYLCGITNYENDSPFFSLSTLQIANIILSALLGSLISLYYHTGKLQRALSFLKAIFALFSINLIIFGIQGIQRKEIVIRFVRYTGTQAVSYGQFSIFLAVLIICGWLLAPILIQKLRKKTKNG